MSFDKEGHWQALTFDERFALVERVKGKANALVKQVGAQGRPGVGWACGCAAWRWSAPTRS